MRFSVAERPGHLRLRRIAQTDDVALAVALHVAQETLEGVGVAMGLVNIRYPVADIVGIANDHRDGSLVCRDRYGQCDESYCRGNNESYLTSKPHTSIPHRGVEHTSNAQRPPKSLSDCSEGKASCNRSSI